MNYKKLLSTTALLFSITVTSADAAFVRAADGTIENGAGSISNVSANETRITQTSGRIDIDWTNFNIDTGKTVTFVQPSTGAVAINRISGGATTIAGILNANGKVVLINKNGMTFASGSQVNVQSLIATTSSTPIDNSELAPSGLNFSRSSKTAGSIVNNGTIKVPAGGRVAFIAPVVTNTGTITQQATKEGKINVDLYGGEFATVSFGSSQVGYTVPVSKLASISVTNAGTINAGGGIVALTASDAATVTGSVMNLSGVIDVTSLSNTSTGGTINVYSGGDITTSATMNANAKSGNSTSAKGGTITLTAKRNITANGNISAHGGSNSQGGKLTMTATTGSIIKGDSTTFNLKGGGVKGNGGSATLYAKTTLTAGGTLDVSSPVLGDGGAISLKAVDGVLTRRSGLTLNASGGQDATPDVNAGKGGTITYYVKDSAKLASGLSGGGVTVNASPRSDSAVAGTVKVDYTTGTDVITSCTIANSGC